MCEAGLGHSAGKSRSHGGAETGDLVHELDMAWHLASCSAILNRVVWGTVIV